VAPTKEIKTDCILYNAEKKDCKGLNCLYCGKEECGFYKSNKEYKADGSKK